MAVDEFWHVETNFQPDIRIGLSNLDLSRVSESAEPASSQLKRSPGNV